MLNFEYYTPTRVVFGKNTEDQVGRLVKEQNCKKVLVHYGSQSAVKSGLLDRIYASLKEASIEYVSLGGVVPNPRISKAREGIELCRKEGVDFILAVGGGSVIDCCKVVSAQAKLDQDIWEMEYGSYQFPTDGIPMGAVVIRHITAIS